MTRIAPRLLGFLLLSGLATSPALAQMYNAGDACPEPTPGRVFTQEGAAGPALVCNGTTLEVYESVLTGPLRKGIGTATPQATLHVNGEAIIGNTSLACSGTTEGAQRYNSTSHVMEYCNGTSWVGFGSGVTSNCPTSDVTSGLVARWKFDESSGTSAADSSGNSLTGTLTNGPVWNPNNGYLNGALTFDGSNDYVTVADPGTGSVLDFAGGTSMTITAWVMMGHDGSLSDFAIISKGATTGVDDANYSFFVGGGGSGNFPELRFAFNNPSGTWHDLYGPEVPGISFVAFSITFGTANTARFYVNGEEFPAQTLSGTPHTTAPLTQNNPLWIGADNEAASGSVNIPFYGNIDDVRIYNRKLTKQEIRDVYNFTSRACN